MCSKLFLNFFYNFFTICWTITVYNTDMKILSLIHILLHQLINSFNRFFTCTNFFKWNDQLIFKMKNWLYLQQTSD